MYTIAARFTAGIQSTHRRPAAQIRLNAAHKIVLSGRDRNAFLRHINALFQAAADGNSQQVTPTPAATALPTPTSAPSPTKKPSKKPSPTKEQEDPDSPKKYLDGKYTASAKGFNGDVKVIVTIKDGVIEALKQENTDTKQFFEKAWSVLEEQIIGTDSVDDIDTVSGATYSSEGILDAAQKALAQAKN